MPTVIALAGRRIDAPGGPPRFPLGRVEEVAGRLTELLRREQPGVLVCSAACGADLVALRCAETLSIRHRIVLPTAPAAFRASSVVDRPGDWGADFDRLVASASAHGDLVIASAAQGGDAAYALVNQRILDEATALAAPASPLAAIVWEGASRGEGDLTAAFAESARERKVRLAEILTT